MESPFPPSASSRCGRDWSAVTHSARIVFGLTIGKLPGSRHKRKFDQSVWIGLAHGGYHELRSPSGHPIPALWKVREVRGINANLFDVRECAGLFAHSGMANGRDRHGIARRKTSLHGLV